MEDQNPNEIMLFEIFCAFRDLEDKYLYQAIDIAMRELNDRKFNYNDLVEKYCNNKAKQKKG